MMKQIKCDVCNNWIKVRTRPDGTPNIVGFTLDNSPKIINVCYGCICKASYDKKTLDKIKQLKGE